MKHDLEGHLARLRELPFVRGVRVEAEPGATTGRGADARIVLETPDGTFRLRVERKRTHLTPELIQDFLTVRRKGIDAHRGRGGKVGARAHDDEWILLARYVPRPLARELVAAGANYLDLEGNCQLRLGERFVALVEGRIPERRGPEGRGLRAPGYQVLFAILARPEILNEGIVRIGGLAGVGKTTVAETLDKLKHDGLLAEVGGKRRLVKPREVLDRWLAGYANAVRPRLLIGRFRTQDADPGQLERRIEQTLGDETGWAWGGGAAAMRLTKHYRGETTILHVARQVPDLPRRLRALRHADGPLVILGAPGPIAFEGALERTIHPLLVYTELLNTGDDRARETALEVRERYLEHLA